MLKNAIFVHVIAFCLALPNLATAENLVEVLRLSLANDPLLNAAIHQKQADLEIRPQARAKLLPTIKLYSRAGRAIQNVHETWLGPPSGTNPLLGSSTYNDFRVTLSLNQPLLNLPHLKNLKTSDIKLALSELNYRVTLQALYLRVAERYFGVLSAGDSLLFARAKKTAIIQQLQQTKHRLEIGLIAATEVHESQARHDLAIANEMKAATAFSNQQETLRRLTGEKSNRLAPLKKNTPLVPPTPSNVEDWVTAAKNSNLNIAQNKLLSEILRLEKEAIRASNYPTIDFNIRYGYNQYGGSFRSTTVDGLASIDLNMTLYEGNISSSKVTQKTHQLKQALRLTEATEREVIQQTRDAYLGVLAGMAYVKALAQALISSDRAFQSTKAGFDVGTRTAIDVLNAQRALFRSKRDLSLARYDYILNTLKLKAAVGLLSIDDLEEVNSWLH